MMPWSRYQALLEAEDAHLAEVPEAGLTSDSSAAEQQAGDSGGDGAASA
jgi:hypothetical protein